MTLHLNVRHFKDLWGCYGEALTKEVNGECFKSTYLFLFVIFYSYFRVLGVVMTTKTEPVSKQFIFTLKSS